MAGEPVAPLYRTFKFRLLPRKAQHVRLRAALDQTRAIYNAALEERISIYRRTGKGTNYNLQCRGITELRSDPSFAEFPVSLQRWPLKRLDDAFKAFFRRCKSGEKSGYPRFRGRDRFKSFGFSDADGWKVSDSRLYMKGIGRVRLHLHRALPSAPVACQIKREAKGWVALLVCGVRPSPLALNGRAIGIDLGITSFVATSLGDTIPGFHSARRSQAEMRRRSRALARCKCGSRNRRKVKKLLVASHEKIARSRRTFLHQVAAQLIRENDLIVIENLNVKGMAQGILARDIHDAGWSIFTQFLFDKAERAGRTVIKVDPRNTSQACSGCGVIVPKALGVRTHKCTDCGLVLDRDVNAARNVLRRAVLRPGALQCRESLA